MSGDTLGLSLEEIAGLLFLHLAADRPAARSGPMITIARKLSLREGNVIRARAGLAAKGPGRLPLPPLEA
jgi:hypothetical protein